MRTGILGLVCVFALVTNVHADTVKTKVGNTYEGKVLQDSDAGVVIQMGYGTRTFKKSDVAEVIRAGGAAAKPASNRPRIPKWDDVVAALAKETWAGTLSQIPATVIDVGVMKAVPYQSYFCGYGYEVNIYGDPDAPSAVEIGLQKGEPKDDAKRKCIALMASLLGDPKDAAILRNADLRKELVTRNGLSIEITPPESEDAYGGWWVSIYDEAQLDKARASAVELAAITTEGVEAPDPAPARAQRPSSATPATPAAVTSTSDSGWSADDYRYVRRRAVIAPAAAPTRAAPTPSVLSHSSARVYVKGYFRKNGTYVRPHSRRR